MAQSSGTSTSYILFRTRDRFRGERLRGERDQMEVTVTAKDFPILVFTTW